MRRIPPLPDGSRRRRSLCSSGPWALGTATAWVCALSACGGAGDPNGKNLGNTAEVTTAAPPVEAETTLASGVWIGEAANPQASRFDRDPDVYHFPSGETRILLDFDSRRAPFIVFGLTARGLPRATDFDAGYPPDVNYKGGPLWDSPVLPPAEGFRYHLTFAENEPAASSELLRLSYAQNEIFSEWCAGQTPQLRLYGDYSCIGGAGVGTADDTCWWASLDDVVQYDLTTDVTLSTPIDCGKAYLCEAAPRPICQCTQSECRINTDVQPQLLLRRAGDGLVGVFSSAVFANGSGALIGIGDVSFRPFDEVLGSSARQDTDLSQP